MPRREPSAAPPSSTTIGCRVNGTGVNGSGTLTCAATIVAHEQDCCTPFMPIDAKSAGGGDHADGMRSVRA